MSASEHPQEHSERGLSSAGAQMQLAREPMFLLLIASAVVYFVLGDVREARK